MPRSQTILGRSGQSFCSGWIADWRSPTGDSLEDWQGLLELLDLTWSPGLCLYGGAT
jgi:hypothetical protein